MMKFLILLATVLSCSFALDILDVKSLNIQNKRFPVDEELVNSFIEKYEEASLGDESQIIAVINEFADRIFANLEVFAANNGLDPILLGDIEEEFGIATITLSNGQLHGISTIDRGGDAEVLYQSSNRLLELFAPIHFSNLNFTYDYHLLILILGPAGNITGNIENFEMDIKIGFDFNTYHAIVETVSSRNTGHIDLIFHGSILDLVINILSEFVSTILHPVIVLIIEGLVSDVANLIVDAINALLDGLLHPTTEAIAAAIQDTFVLL